MNSPLTGLYQELQQMHELNSRVADSTSIYLWSIFCSSLDGQLACTRQFNDFRSCSIFSNELQLSVAFIILPAPLIIPHIVLQEFVLNLYHWGRGRKLPY